MQSFRHVDWCCRCHLQSMASKVSLNITSIPLNWKWEGAWMSMHGRFLWVRSVLVPFTFYWLDLRHIVTPNGMQWHEGWGMYSYCVLRNKRAWIFVNSQPFIQEPEWLELSYSTDENSSHGFLFHLKWNSNFSFSFLARLYPLYVILIITLFLFHNLELKFAILLA